MFRSLVAFCIATTVSCVNINSQVVGSSAAMPGLIYPDLLAEDYPIVDGDQKDFEEQQTDIKPIIITEPEVTIPLLTTQLLLLLDLQEKERFLTE